MSSSKRLLHLADEFQPPAKRLISEADMFIKELAMKQQITSTNLNYELANPKEFYKAEELISLANYNAGSCSLEEFKATRKHFDDIGNLKAAGLAEDEITLYLDYQKGEDYLLNKHKTCEKSSLQETINRIKNIVKKHKQQSSVLNCGRSEATTERLNSGLSIKPCSTATKLYKFALDNEKLKKKCSVPSPMDNIKHIEENFVKSLNVEKLPNISNIRRKARKLVNRLHHNNQTSDCRNDFEEFKTTKAAKSKWDEKSPPPPTYQKQVYTCSPQNYYTIKDGAIVKLGKEECHVRDLPYTQKLTIDEIKQLPKFQDYTKGVPSKVLYLKNLSNSVKETDLKHLFKDFDRNGDVGYKIMNRKLRGQAFVTFTDDVVAMQALNDLNGTVLKNKPVIIQFGCGKG